VLSQVNFVGVACRFTGNAATHRSTYSRTSFSGVRIAHNMRQRKPTGSPLENSFHFNFTLRFSADVLPLFDTSSYSTRCPSLRLD
jgi:hypothetical protein